MRARVQAYWWRSERWSRGPAEWGEQSGCWRQEWLEWIRCGAVEPTVQVKEGQSTEMQKFEGVRRNNSMWVPRSGGEAGVLILAVMSNWLQTNGDAIWLKQCTACGIDADDSDESEPTTTMSLKLLKGPTELRGNCYMGLSLQAAHLTNLIHC